MKNPFKNFPKEIFSLPTFTFVLWVILIIFYAVMGVATKNGFEIGLGIWIVFTITIVHLTRGQGYRLGIVDSLRVFLKVMEKQNVEEKDGQAVADELLESWKKLTPPDWLGRKK